LVQNPNFRPRKIFKIFDLHLIPETSFKKVFEKFLGLKQNFLLKLLGDLLPVLKGENKDFFVFSSGRKSPRNLRKKFFGLNM